MQKSEIKILIIEDDMSLGRAIEEGLRRSGYTTTLVTGYSQALNAVEMADYNGLVVDCMLPQKSGLELAVEILKGAATEVTTIFTSGVFKDRSYVHDALVKTKGKAFLTKPFDLQTLIGHFDDAFKSMIDEHHEPLHQLLMREQFSSRDKIVALNNSEYIHGFDLPYVYNLLIDPQISGRLEIQYDESQPITVIGFNRGRIDQVLYHDKESYFGVLLIEKGFTTPEELQRGLAEQEKTPIGQFLVENSYVSPHAIEIVHNEQMIIRISKTIQDTSVKIKFIEEPRPDSAAYIDAFMLPSLLNDWINTKLTGEWLRSFYLPWLDHPILKGADAGKMSLLSNISSGRAFANFANKNNWPHTLHELLSQNPAQELALLKGVHFFALQRVIFFGPKNTQNENYDAKISRLQKILTNFKNKNYFEVLGVSTKARPSEIDRAYRELAKNLHPDKLNPKSPDEVKKLSQSVFAIVTDAYQTLSNDKKREHYQRTLEVGLAEDILKAESAFEAGMKLLNSNQFRDARKTFEKTMTMKGHRSDAVIFMIWALIKEKRHKSDRKALAAKAKDLLHRVAHEDRHSPPYFFVKGMCYELTGQIQKAYQHFKHCEIIDPHFYEARKEMIYIKKHYVDNRSRSLSEDLGTVVTKIFKKKSG